eukprot:TRINITY_DN6111_c0_g1_i2.p1 TRINITY_DN6111_c0_g1~~TRINITY_DN6111_c0_g1_i2.p1  ORF type:complete len:403 (-),score=163.77 TRINITY_DN6111_c0_g1_i2:96-1280(-)
MKKKRGGGALGKSIQRDKDRRRRAAPENFEFKKYYEPDKVREEEKQKSKLVSVTHESNLTEFVKEAELADREFEVEKQNVVVLKKDSFMIRTEPTAEQKAMMLKEWNKLKIPRRPEWSYSDSAEEIDKKERDSFLQWRRQLAELEKREDLILTPFEKNIEVWRQLWRVVERSDIIVQIVDARNPVIRCIDLENYVYEIAERQDRMKQQQQHYAENKGSYKEEKRNKRRRNRNGQRSTQPKKQPEPEPEEDEDEDEDEENQPQESEETSNKETNSNDNDNNNKENGNDQNEAQNGDNQKNEGENKDDEKIVLDSTSTPTTTKSEDKRIGSSKKVVLLVNKADLLTSSQRQIWCKYFKSQNLSFMFWSAFAAQIRLQEPTFTVPSSSSVSCGWSGS